MAIFTAARKAGEACDWLHERYAQLQEKAVHQKPNGQGTREQTPEIVAGVRAGKRQPEAKEETMQPQEKPETNEAPPQDAERTDQTKAYTVRLVDLVQYTSEVVVQAISPEDAEELARDNFENVWDDSRTVERYERVVAENQVAVKDREQNIPATKTVAMSSNTQRREGT